MKIESINKEVQEKVMQLLNDAPAEKKAEAIMQSIEMIQRQYQRQGSSWIMHRLP